MKGKKKRDALSLLARECANVSGLKSKLYVDMFEKDAFGVPLASNSIHWSISHKPDFVAGVVSTQKIGIDLEQIKNVSDALFERIVGSKEGAHFKNQSKDTIFFRVFTAKEAVLKKTTDGIKGLSKVKVKTVVDDKNLIVQYIDQKYLIENFYFEDYLASVTKDNVDVQWTII
ncbi:4'-phosphopantetheinyl transferase family protein [Desulfobacula sp.]